MLTDEEVDDFLETNYNLSAVLKEVIRWAYDRGCSDCARAADERTKATGAFYKEDEPGYQRANAYGQMVEACRSLKHSSG